MGLLKQSYFQLHLCKPEQFFITKMLAIEPRFLFFVFFLWDGMLVVMYLQKFILRTINMLNLAVKKHHLINNFPLPLEKKKETSTQF